MLATSFAEEANKNTTDWLPVAELWSQDLPWNVRGTALGAAVRQAGVRAYTEGRSGGPHRAWRGRGRVYVDLFRWNILRTRQRRLGQAADGP